MIDISFDDYLNVDAINYSLLKNIDENGRLYKFKKKRDGPALSLGTLVDDLVLPTEEEKKYFITHEEPPTASLLVLADAVVEYCKINNIVYKDISKELILKLINDNNLWSKNSEEVKLGKFKDNKQFYSYIEGKLSPNLSISPDMWSKANELKDILITHPYTKDIFSKGLNQKTYIFVLDGITYKIRLDKLVIDDENKVISPYDLKTGEVRSINFEFNFYKFKYYLQQSLYQLGVLHYVTKNYPDYSLDNFKFIYISTSEPNPHPIIWESSEEWAELGYTGFSKNGRHYKGIRELVNEYLFYEKNSVEIEYEAYLKNGIIKIPTPI